MFRPVFYLVHSLCVAATLLLAPLGLASCGANGGPRPASPPVPATPPPAGERPVEARLVADVTAVAPGESFRVGVELRMKPGWHIYWKNPGDAGLATSVEIVVPEGFGVSALMWPVPRRFSEPGDIAGYGYSESVLLMARVTAPRSLRPGTPLRVAARVRWLSCERLCIPGSAELETEVAAAGRSAPAERELFAAWAARLPDDATRPGAPARVRVEPGARSARRAAYAVVIDWAAAPKSVEWFPGPDPARSIESTRAETDGMRTRISFETELLAGQKPASDVLEVLVAYEGADGVRRGLLVPVALAEASPAAAGE